MPDFVDSSTLLFDRLILKHNAFEKRRIKIFLTVLYSLYIMNLNVLSIKCNSKPNNFGQMKRQKGLENKEFPTFLTPLFLRLKSRTD